MMVILKLEDAFLCASYEGDKWNVKTTDLFSGVSQNHMLDDQELAAVVGQIIADDGEGAIGMSEQAQACLSGLNPDGKTRIESTCRSLVELTDRANAQELNDAADAFKPNDQQDTRIGRVCGKVKELLELAAVNG